MNCVLTKVHMGNDFFQIWNVWKPLALFKYRKSHKSLKPTSFYQMWNDVAHVRPEMTALLIDLLTWYTNCLGSIRGLVMAFSWDRMSVLKSLMSTEVRQTNKTTLCILNHCIFTVLYVYQHSFPFVRRIVLCLKSGLALCQRVYNHVCCPNGSTLSYVVAFRKLSIYLSSIISL